MFKTFVNIQNAWMDFNYDKLRELCTDELYNSYKTQLEILKAKDGQNIMSDYQNLETKIIDIEVQNGILTMQVFMKVCFFDYVINTKNK